MKACYKITLENGVWYDVYSEINNTEEFLMDLFGSPEVIQVFKVKDKSLCSNTDHVAFKPSRVCSVEWKGVSK